MLNWKIFRPIAIAISLILSGCSLTQNAAVQPTDPVQMHCQQQLQFLQGAIK